GLSFTKGQFLLDCVQILFLGGPTMTLISRAARRSVEALSELHYCNPFLEGRIEKEREALGADFHEGTKIRSELDYSKDENLNRLGRRIEQVTEELRLRLNAGAEAEERELAVYQDLVLYLLYRRYRIDLEQAIAKSIQESAK